MFLNGRKSLSKNICNKKISGRVLDSRYNYVTRNRIRSRESFFLKQQVTNCNCPVDRADWDELRELNYRIYYGGKCFNTRIFELFISRREVYKGVSKLDGRNTSN